MKKSITILALFGAGLFAQSGQTPASGSAPTAAKKKKSAASEAKKPSSPAAQPLTIPADAVPNPDGSYAYTDPAGKKWIYRKTPFGLYKSEDTGNDAAASAPSGAPGQQWTKVTDNGETVKFERESPFGTVWVEKKKSDLTAQERTLLDNQTAKSQ